MAEAMTNGHMMANHVNNGDGALSNGPSSKDLAVKKEQSSSSKHSSSSKDHSSSKHKHGSSHHSSSSKHHSSSSSSSKHKEGSSSSSKHHSSSSSKHHSSSSSKDPSKHHSSSKDPSKSHSSSSSSKHHGSSSKHHSSSKHKEGSSSHSTSSKHKDGSGSSKPASSKSHDLGKPAEKAWSPEPVRVKSETMQRSVSPSSFAVSALSPLKIKTDPTSPLKMKIKNERLEYSDDDMPLSSRVDKVKVEPKQESPPKRSHFESDDDEEPLSHKLEKAKKVKKEELSKKRKHEDDDFEPVKKKKKKDKKKEGKAPVKSESKADIKKKEEENTKWKWWEEEKMDTDIKWTFLEHNGVLFAPEYEPLPSNIHFLYNGKKMKLTEPTEEVATFYGRMLDHDYTTKEVFNRNFFKDWRKVMTKEERETLTDLTKCDFRQILTHFKEQSEIRKAMSKEEKQVIKKQNEGLVEKYGWCTIDKYKQKIGNFRIEPPGLFRGRGDHPKQGMLKKRTMPEDVIINCSRGAKVPEPPAGHRWKEVRHDPKVTWLACWNENIQNSTKYVMLNAASKLKGEKDWKKYEMARGLHRNVDRIRAQYREDWKSKEMRIRQRAVAMYFIDKLALRAGNEKDEDQADTVGCCSLRVEHINLHEKFGDKEHVVEFDFLGKDSIRYFNQVSVEKRVFKNLQLFKDNKSEGDDLFDRLTTTTLNKHLQGLMEGLTAKVFRTYNASKTLQEQLNLLTKAEDGIPAKILSYNRANRAVAVLCNHQRAAPKNFDKQMENMNSKIEAKKNAIHDAKREVKQAKSDAKVHRTENAKKLLDRKKKAVDRLEDQLTKLEVQATDKDENKEIALGTSKLNYLDPRISVGWCKKWEVPIEKVYNKTQRDKFAWAIDMAEADFEF